MEASPEIAIKPRLGQPLPSFRLRTRSLNTLRLRRVFDLFDGNGDGEISSAELSHALERLGLGADPAEIDPLVAAHFPPGRSGLDFEAFQGLHQALGDALFGVGGDANSAVKAEEESDMEEAFKVFDADGDGFISAKELQSVLSKLQLAEAGSIERVHQMICSVDRNNDGRVDFGEFKNMMSTIAVV